jgi:hypothetical protein
VVDAARLLSETDLLVRRGPYAIAAWSTAQAEAVIGSIRASDGFAMLILDELEVSAVIREETLAALPAPREVAGGWSVVTLDQAMSWDVVGVLSEITSALAGAGISVGAGTAFSRDHVLVPTARLSDALGVLAPLCAEVRFNG